MGRVEVQFAGEGDFFLLVLFFFGHGDYVLVARFEQCWMVMGHLRVVNSAEGSRQLHDPRSSLVRLTTSNRSPMPSSCIIH
jgi:hypothetical protein